MVRSALRTVYRLRGSILCEEVTTREIGKHSGAAEQEVCATSVEPLDTTPRPVGKQQSLSAG